ncbi:hypothetical protein [Pseudomonas sp. C11]|uniref:hypothetical protein n=1 Tax=Pseudomonas sp. C11 TaxID=3075550 RepID=UPI002AFF5D20|nr:hypothetical protein [Pseudomonas sp. C11]
MSPTFTATLPCHRPAPHRDASSQLTSASCAGFVAVFVHAFTCSSEDRLLIPAHD